MDYRNQNFEGYKPAIYPIPPERIEEHYYNIFDYYLDHDRSGKVDAGYVPYMMDFVFARCCGSTIKPTKMDVMYVLNAIDADKSGMIDSGQFWAMIRMLAGLPLDN